MLRRRAVVAIVAIPIIAAFVVVGGLPLFGLIVLVTVVGTVELYFMLAEAGFRPPWVLGVALALVPLVDAQSGGGLLAPGMTAGMVAAIIYFLVRGDAPFSRFQDFALTITGALYVGLQMRHAVLLANLPRPVWWLVLALGASWLADTGAYFVGRAWGRHPLAPRLSPQKTWEGVAGCLASSTAFAVALPFLVDLTGLGVFLGPAPYPGLPPFHGLALGLLVGVAAVVGDLGESMMKRAAGAKESGWIVPGHGGLLDRMDSLMLVLVAVYYYGVWVIGVG